MMTIEISDGGTAQRIISDRQKEQEVLEQEREQREDGLSSREIEQQTLEQERSTRRSTAMRANEEQSLDSELNEVALMWPIIRSVAELVRDYHHALIQTGFTEDQATVLVGSTLSFLGHRLK